jgi:hypothetical protein
MHTTYIPTRQKQKTSGKNIQHRNVSRDLGKGIPANYELRWRLDANYVVQWPHGDIISAWSVLPSSCDQISMTFLRKATQLHIYETLKPSSLHIKASRLAVNPWTTLKPLLSDGRTIMSEACCSLTVPRKAPVNLQKRKREHQLERKGEPPQVIEYPKPFITKSHFLTAWRILICCGVDDATVRATLLARSRVRHHRHPCWIRWVVVYRRHNMCKQSYVSLVCRGPDCHVVSLFPQSPRTRSAKRCLTGVSLPLSLVAPQHDLCHVDSTVSDEHVKYSCLDVI